MTGRDGPSLYIVHSSPVPGREQEYHDWYGRHLAQLLAVPGFASAQRFALSPVARSAAMPPARHSHLAIYEITGDPGLAFGALERARSAGAVTPSAAVAGDIAGHLFVPVTRRLLAPGADGGPRSG